MNHSQQKINSQIIALAATVHRAKWSYKDDKSSCFEILHNTGDALVALAKWHKELSDKESD